MRYELVERNGRHAVIRRLPNGDAAGFDAQAAREHQQRHFQIHREWPSGAHIDAAFHDSRSYRTLAEADAALAWASMNLN